MPLNINGANHQHRFLQKRSSLFAQACKKNLGLYIQVLILEGKEGRIWPSPQTENSILCKAVLKSSRILNLVRTDGSDTK